MRRNVRIVVLILLTAHASVFSQTYELETLDAGYYAAESLAYPQAYIDAHSIYQSPWNVRGLMLFVSNIIAIRTSGDVIVSLNSEDGQTCDNTYEGAVRLCAFEECFVIRRGKSWRAVYVPARYGDIITIQHESGDCQLVEGIQVLPHQSKSQPTPTFEVYSTIGEQNTRFDYTVTAGDVSITLTLVAVLVSIWVISLMGRK